MGPKYDEIMGRNRRRIAGLAFAGLVNYWIAVLLFIVAVVVGSILGAFVWGLVEGADFDLVWGLIKGVPKAFSWVIDAGWLSSAAMTWVLWGFIGFGTLMAISMMRGGLRKLEQSVPRVGASHPDATNVLEAVALAAGVPAPPLVVLQDPAVNSCSVGRRPGNATILITSGAIEKLTRDELEAVMAYELSRVRSFDTALSTWTAAVTGRTIELSETTDRLMVKLALLVPVGLARRLRARTLKRQAGQRDILALSFTRHPEALISALQKIDADTTGVTTLALPTGPLWLEWPWPGSREREGAPALGGRIEELRTLVAALPA
jgi:Zn-dependent protease with chaperone function